MKKPSLFLTLFLCTVSGLNARAESLLITAFDSFSGRSRNRSADVAQLLQQKLAVSRPDLQVQVCYLNVIYDRASEEALACLRSMPTPPSRILSLGESRCQISLETRARNWDQDRSPDNAGQLRAGSEIYPGWPAYLGFANFPVRAMRARLSAADAARVTLSSDMEGFVCNNTAYRMMADPQVRGARYGFIHVPREACGPRAGDPWEVSRIIEEMIR